MNELDCNNCKHSEVWTYSEPCASCEDRSKWEPYTNGDRLRAWPDWKLAEFLNSGGMSCPPQDCPGEDDCVKCWIDWLNAPAKERFETVEYTY